MLWAEKIVMITGGTGSFGRRLADVLHREHRPRGLIVFSRGENKQLEMRQSGLDGPGLRYVIGDVRDARRLREAMEGAHVVVHAAALKHVPVCEENPGEAVATNVAGTRHVVEAALDLGVERVLALSTDKAVSPAGVYGATKLLAERLVVEANPRGKTRLAAVRLGNIAGSRGSVIPVLIAQRSKGVVTVTDERMTRFWMSVEHAVRFALRALDGMTGGEVFVPRLPSLALGDLVKALAPGCRIEVIGPRPGEKAHETLVSAEEGPRTLEIDDYLVVPPPYAGWRSDRLAGARRVPEGFRFTSEDGGGSRRLTAEELRRLVE